MMAGGRFLCIFRSFIVVGEVFLLNGPLVIFYAMGRLLSSFSSSSGEIDRRERKIQIQKNPSKEEQVELIKVEIP
jgi:hypothetical protein